MVRFLEKIKFKEIGAVAIGFLIIDILQTFAFTQESSPFYISSIGGAFNYLVLLIAICALAYGASNKKMILDGSRALLIISFIIYWFLAFVHSYGHLTIFSIMPFMVLSIFIVSKNDILQSTYRAFYMLFVVMSIFSIIAFLGYFTGLLRPYSIEPFYEEFSQSEYANYIVSYVLQPIGLPRACGLYNEPGMFGTIGALVLVAERFRMNAGNIIILLACLMTLSVAFFILVAVYLILRAILKKQFYILIVFLVATGLFYYLSTLSYSDENVNLFFNRFVFEDGELAGDNRSGESDYVWNTVLHDDWKLMFGYGQYSLDAQVTSYRRLIINHGIIGTALFLIPLIFGAIKYGGNSKDSILLVTVFIASIYQRPEIYNMGYFVVLIGGIANMGYVSNEVNNIKSLKECL